MFFWQVWRAGAEDLWVFEGFVAEPLASKLGFHKLERHSLWHYDSTQDSLWFTIPTWTKEQRSVARSACTMSTLFSLGMKAWISVFCLERCWQMPSILWCFSLLCSIGLRPLYVWSRSTILPHQWLLAAWFCDLVCSNWPCARAKWTPKKSQRNMWHLAKVLCWNHHFGHNTCCLDVYRQSGSTHTPILEFSLNWWKIQIINILIVRSCKTYSYIYIYNTKTLIVM